MKLRRRNRLGMGAIALLGLWSCTGAGDDGAPADPRPPSPAARSNGDPGAPQAYKADEILVRFKAGVGRGRAAAVHAKHAARVLREYRAPADLQLVQVPPGATVAQALEDYRRDPEVLYAEPNRVYHLSVAPDDPSFGGQWGLHNTGQTGGLADADINAPEAWSITTGSRAVVIGVVDTGVDYTHEDLAANMFTNPGEIAGNGIDDDANGWVDDVHGINTALESGDPMDIHGHGTHVVGTIAARGNNGIGVAGVSWGAAIVSCKAFNPGAFESDILQCLDYFLELKTRPTDPVDIVATNNSWGGASPSQALEDAIDAHRQAGMLFVASAGNVAQDLDENGSYPASFDHDNIITVLATDHLDQLASFEDGGGSNFGARTVDVGAPGKDVLSTLPGNRYGLRSGTSMAAPHVTGLVGLLKAQDPTRDAQQIKNLILAGGAPTPGTAGRTLSGRRIRADGSLGCAGQPLANRFAPVTSTVFVELGMQVPLGMLALACDRPSAGPQRVTVVETGETIALIDADASGRFEGSYAPVRTGTVTLAFPGGDTVTVTVARNYDWAMFVPFEPPAIAGTVLPLACDECAATIESPFPIRFGGTAPGATTLHVGSNGVLSFSAPISAGGNQPLPLTLYETIVAPFWDDLSPAVGGSVRYEVVGQAPSRQLVIEYRDVPHASVPGSAATFQVVFFEDSPNVQLNYADVQLGSEQVDNGASATVGLQVAGGVARELSSGWPSLSDGLSLLFTMTAPVALAGPDRVVSPRQRVKLDGSHSQNLGGPLVSYAWTQTAGTPVELRGADTATPSFKAPAGPGTLTFQLDVINDQGWVDQDSIDVIVRP